MRFGLKRNRMKIAAVIIFALMPCLLALELFFRGNYGVTSVIIVLLAMLPFFMMFEKRRPKAREIVPIAVMSALAAVSRMAFVLLPQFKPIIAVVIITALAFGAEAGFLTGAVSMLVSNFFFGQGPWTPWQMFCCGMVGFLAGLLRSRGLLKSKPGICAFGVLSGYFYGMTVDISTVLSISGGITWQAVLAVYISGFWFNTVLAIATAFFLFVLERPLVASLERIKVKFGLLEDT